MLQDTLLHPEIRSLADIRQDMIDAAQRDTDEHNAIEQKEKKTSDVDVETSAGQKPHAHTLYHSLLSSSMPESEKRPQRMAHEGFEILLAGSDTTARTMGIAAYHLMANPHCQERLLEQLKTVMPNPHSPVALKDLESLPYLTAVMKEALRIGKVTDHRLSLVAPNEDLVYGEWTIPRGTRVSMTPTRNSYDEKYFPEPMRFAPERWLQEVEKVGPMNHVFMPFAHGRRGCLGLQYVFSIFLT